MSTSLFGSERRVSLGLGDVLFESRDTNTQSPAIADVDDFFTLLSDTLLEGPPFVSLLMLLFVLPASVEDFRFGGGVLDRRSCDRVATAAAMSGPTQYTEICSITEVPSQPNDWFVALSGLRYIPVRCTPEIS